MNGFIFLATERGFATHAAFTHDDFDARLFNNISRNSPSNAKRWVGMDSEPSFSSAIFDLRYISL